MNDMAQAKPHFQMVTLMKANMNAGKDTDKELIVSEILRDMSESIRKEEDTDMAHFGIQVPV